MATRRLLSAVVILSTCYASAQTPNFSGVYLGELTSNSQIPRAPIVLEISQTASDIAITYRQNGAQATRHFDPGGAPTANTLSAGNSLRDRVKFRSGRLLIESLIPANPDKTTGGYQVKVKESWELSPDARILTIQRKAPESLLGPFRQTETYTRQPSLEFALQQSETYSEMSQCVSGGLPEELAMDLALLDLPAGASRKTKHDANMASYATPVLAKYGKAVVIGYAGIHRLGRCTWFSADLSGDLFNDLQRAPTSAGLEFRKKDQLLTTYSDSVVLEVEPSLWDCRPWWEVPHKPFVVDTTPHSSNLPTELLELRFELTWKGSKTRDLGEVPAELMTEPMSELRLPGRFYRLHVPSRDVLLTDVLEIHVFSKSGQQLACIQGHI